MSTSAEVIAGVGLADRPRKSRWPARLDFAQSGTGLALGLFMWGHLFFVSTILLGKDAMWSVTKFFEGYFFFGQAHPGAVSVIAAAVVVLFVAHAFLAMRKFPANVGQLRTFAAHRALLKHGDTTLWWVQFLTGFALFFLAPPHLYQMLVEPGGIGPHFSAFRMHAGGWGPLYLALLVAVGLHGGIGLYRLVVKWGWIEGADAGRTRRVLVRVAWALIAVYFALGLVADTTYLRIGRELGGRPAEEYAPAWAKQAAHGEGRP
ncbi:MAG TPA: fumarate reductase cytochrome b subunit [bacterium]